MNYIFIECLFISAVMLALLTVSVFSKRWKNVLFYLLLSTFAVGTISLICDTLFGISRTLYLLLPYSIFFIISIFYYGTLKSKSKPRKNEDIFKLESKKGTIEFYYPRDNFMVLGGAGSGRSYRVMDGKEVIYISLTELNTKEYYKGGMMLDDNVCPVTYRSYRIWAIRSTMFWYAIECDRKFYAFDIRKVVEQMRISIDFDFDWKVCLHRHEWMVDFVEKMNKSDYVIDVEVAIAIEALKLRL